MGKKLPNITLFGEEIGEMSQYSTRDNLIKNGVSTVQYDRIISGYVVQDFVTFRRMPDQSETAKDWRFVRDIIIDFNIAFNYQVLQNRTLMGKVIVKDGENIQSDRRGDVLYLSVWKSAVVNFIEQMISLAYITDFEYSKNSLLVEISGTNPKRINTQFAYKRTSVANITSTTAYAGFSFGLEA
jgi:phage tail sheath gpL-like